VQLVEVDPLQAEVTQTQLDLLAQVFGAPDGQPGAGALPGQAALGGDDQVVGVRVQRLPDELLDGERTVGVGGVDEIDAQLDRPAQHAHRLVAVSGLAPDAGAGQAHGAEAEAADRQVAAEAEATAPFRGVRLDAGAGRVEVRLPDLFECSHERDFPGFEQFQYDVT
jgi:hypothetical protein